MFDYEVVVCGSVTVAWSARGSSVLLCWLWGPIAGRVIISCPYNNFHSHHCNIHANPHCRDRDWRLGGCVLLAKRVVVIANWQPRFSLIWKKNRNTDDDHDELSQWGLVRPQSCATRCPCTHCTWLGSHKARCAQLAGSNHFIWMRWNRTPSFLKKWVASNMVAYKYKILYCYNIIIHSHARCWE